MLTTLVTCVNCAAVQDPGETWRCYSCSDPLKYGVETAVCERCEKHAKHRRVGFELKTLCDCNLSAYERARRDRDRQREEQHAAAAALAAQERLVEEQRRRAMAYNAAKCWSENDERCAIGPANLPFAHCSLCPRFAKRADKTPTQVHERRRRELAPPADPRFKHIPMEEIDCA